VRLLADESVDFAIVRALRSEEHDVLAISEEYAGAPDEDVAALARADGRVLLTEDRDFGRLFYAEMRGAAGVILIRYPARARANCAADVVSLVRRRGDELGRAFVVMQPGRIRVGRLPDAGT